MFKTHEAANLAIWALQARNVNAMANDRLIPEGGFYVEKVQHPSKENWKITVFGVSGGGSGGGGGGGGGGGEADRGRNKSREFAVLCVGLKGGMLDDAVL